MLLNKTDFGYDPRFFAEGMSVFDWTAGFGR